MSILYIKIGLASVQATPSRKAVESVKSKIVSLLSQLKQWTPDVALPGVTVTAPDAGEHHDSSAMSLKP